MAQYHSYVFNEKERSFVGRFDEMYQAENHKLFDSWQQEDLRDRSKKYCLTILEEYSFGRILDVGCGKGALTQFLKKKNNYVKALDVSATALNVARSRYPDIDFAQADLVSQRLAEVAGSVRFDLILCLETLSYLENWKQVVSDFAATAEYCLIALFVPPDPIGFVKSVTELAKEFSGHFEVLEDMRLLTQQRVILFGKSHRNSGAGNVCQDLN